MTVHNALIHISTEDVVAPVIQGQGIGQKGDLNRLEVFISILHYFQYISYLIYGHGK